jgi:hypothetical protein
VARLESLRPAAEQQQSAELCLVSCHTSRQRVVTAPHPIRFSLHANAAFLCVPALGMPTSSTAILLNRGRRSVRHRAPSPDSACRGQIGGLVPEPRPFPEWSAAGACGPKCDTVQTALDGATSLPFAS